MLRASTSRLFAYGGVTFRYPEAFSWEANIEGPRSKRWTLSGNDFKIMYFVLPDVLTLDGYAYALLKQFGARNTRVNETTRTLGGRRLPGRLLDVTLRART